MGKINLKNDGKGLVPANIALDKEQRLFLAEHQEILLGPYSFSGGWGIIIARGDTIQRLIDAGQSIKHTAEDEERH